MCIIDCLSTIVFILPLHLDYTKVIILILWWRNFQLEYWRTFQLVSTNANDFKNSLEKQVLTYTKGNVERSFERILSPTGWGLKEYVPLKKGY